MHSIENQATKKISLEEVEAKFDQLYALAKKLAAYESSGLKKACEIFQAKLKQCKGGVQNVSALSSIQRMMDSTVARVASWTQAEAREEAVTDAQIRTLVDSLSSMTGLLKVKPIKSALAQTQEIKAETQRGSAEEEAILVSSGSTDSIPSASSSREIGEAEVTLLKEQLTQLERALREEARAITSAKAELEKRANRAEAGRRRLNALQSKPAKLAEHAFQMESFIEESRDFLREEPIILDEESQSSLNASAGEALLAAKGDKDAFYAQKKIKDQQAEIARLQALAENQELKDCVDELTRKTQELETENTGLYEALSNNQGFAKGLLAENRQLKQELTELAEGKASDDEITAQLLQKQLQVVADNKRLIGNLEEENRRYLELEAESRAALSAKKEAEESKAWAIQSVDAKHVELQQEIHRREEAERDLGLKGAELQRVLEDLRGLTEDVVGLAELAEGLKKENAELYTESQYGYFRGKCDDLTRRQKELLERARAAEKESWQAGLDAGFQASHDQKAIHDLKAQIEILQAKIIELEQECHWLKGQGPHEENERLKAKLSHERATKFSDVLGRFDNAAAQAAQKLSQTVEAQKAEIATLQKENTELKAIGGAHVEESSKWAGRVKTVAMGAGLVLAGIATVAGLGLLGAAAVAYALPLLGIGLVVAVGGFVVSKLLESRERDKADLLEVKKVETGQPPRTVLTVKEALSGSQAEYPQNVITV